MTTAVGLQLINVFKEPLLKLVKEVKEEFLQTFYNGLSDYIDNYYEKFSHTKTFIYRDEKINFYDVYYPVTIKNRRGTSRELKELQELFASKKFISIIGSAGSGKSMLMKHIYLSTIKQSYSIPIIIELRNLNDFSGTLTDYIYKILTKNKLASSDKIIERILAEGHFIFLLDGYDEIYSLSKNKVTADLEEFVDTYHRNTFVLTSRPGANAESLQRFDNYYVQPLTHKQVKEFINLQFKTHENKESIGKIISVVEKPENRDYNEYLSNPLLLSMFIFTFNSYPELPKSKHKFYWNVFDTLATKHDAFTKKGFWLHERKSKLQNEDFENILKWFSYITIFSGKYNFDLEYLKTTLSEIKEKLKLKSDIDDVLYDLCVSISILIQDGTEYTFPHKSLQEYFAAVLIKGLTEEQKKIIYSEKFKKLNDNTLGGNSNFYKLCFELDKINFSKYYLIPRTTSLLEKVESDTEENLIKTFIKAIGLNFELMKNEDHTFEVISYGTDIDSIHSYLSFFWENELFVPEWDILQNEVEKINGYLKEKYEEESNTTRLGLTLDFADNFDNTMLEFAKASGLCENIKTLYKSIVTNLNILQDEIISENMNTQQLLSI